MISASNCKGAIESGTDDDRNSLRVGAGPDRLLDADVEYDPLDAPAYLTYQTKTSVV
jgi:hypothetical protein